MAFSEKQKLLETDAKNRAVKIIFVIYHQFQNFASNRIVKLRGASNKPGRIIYSLLKRLLANKLTLK